MDKQLMLDGPIGAKRLNFEQNTASDMLVERGVLP
jgi:hypothetical protein